MATTTRKPAETMATSVLAPSPSETRRAHTLLVELRAGAADNVLLAALCGACGTEAHRAQTDVPRAPIAAAWVDGNTQPGLDLAGWAVLRLPIPRCSCGQPLPGPIVRTRVELPEAVV